MSLVSRLALPAVLGGIAALFASGVFMPPVYAGAPAPERIARVAIALELRAAPAASADPIGAFPARTPVWIEECTGTDWCRVARGGATGWVKSSHLTITHP